jgi:hypothetical protein
MSRRPSAAPAAVVAVILIALQTAVFLDNAFADRPPRWGVIAYLSGQGGLETEADGYWSAILTSAAAGQCAAAVQVDGPDICGRWLAAPAANPQFTPMGVVNMGAADEFGRFVAWALQHAKAERYVLIVMGHGSGLATLSPELSGVAFDGGQQDSLTVAELAQGLTAARSAGTQLEVVCLDSCYSASFEVAYCLQEIANYLVASPTRVPSPGLPWPSILATLDSYADGAALAEALMSVYSGDLVGADLICVPAVAAALKGLAEALSADIRQAAPALRHARSYVPSWGYRDEMCDMVRLAEQLRDYGPSGAVSRNAGRLADSLRQVLIQPAIVATANADERSRHLGLFFPATWEPVPAHYREMYEMARETGWADLLELCYESVGITEGSSVSN